MRSVFKGGIIALDINSRSVGVAFGDCDSPAPRCTTWLPGGCEDDDALIRSCAGLYNSIVELSKIVHPAFVIVEAPLDIPGRNPRTGRALLSLAFVGATAAQNVGARPVLGHVGTWRKHFTGQGRPEDPKGATMERCRILGWTVKNHDEGDASGLWCWGMSKYFPRWSPNGTPLFARKEAAA